MASFESHIRFLTREIEALGRAPVLLSPQSFLRAICTEWTPEADEASRVFARTLMWPPLTEPVRVEVTLRLMSAREWFQDVTPEDDDLLNDGGEQLTELLIDYWKDNGRYQLLWPRIWGPETPGWEGYRGERLW